MKWARRWICRMFQTSMRLLFPFLPYRNPQILHAINQIDTVKKQHPLIVTGSHTSKSEGMKELIHHYDNVTIFDGVKANPTTEMIDTAFQLYEKEHCDHIIGFGGGSSLDCAKAVAAQVAQPRKSIAQMAGVLKVCKQTPFMILIPTTAGTGSETTIAAVVTDSQTHHKYAINDFSLIPDVAILEPALTLSLPPHLTASTGMDALTHAMEAYIGRSTTKQTRQEALEAIRLIYENILVAYQEGTNIEARKNMLHASYLAGDAFSKSYVGYVHAIAHSLGGQYNLPHGQTNATLLPIVLKAYGHPIDKKLHDMACVVGLADESTSDAQAAQRMIQSIQKLNRAMDIPSTIPQIRKEDIALMARYADQEANPLYPVPVLWDQKELGILYEQAMDKPKNLTTIKEKKSRK